MKYEISAKRLKDRITILGLRAQDVADRTKIDKSSISQYLSGAHAPNTKTAQKLALALGGNPLWYMGFDVPFSYTMQEEAMILFNKLPEDEQEFIFRMIRDRYTTWQMKQAEEAAK